MAHYVIGCKTSNFHESLGVVVGGLVPDPPTTTPKLQLDFKSKKSSCSLGVVVGGSGTRHSPTTTTTSNFDKKIF